MGGLKSFIKTTLLGGFLVVIPVVLVIFIINGLYNFITDKIRPITQLLVYTAQMNEYVASILAALIILLLFFIVGLTVKTKVGHYTYSLFDEKILKRIPFYSIIKETVVQLFSSDKNFFKSVALVNLFCNETLVTAFITDEHPDGSYTVFVPSGPAPTAGFVYHLKGEFVHIIDYPVDQALRTIISMGAGSKDLVELLNKKRINK
ncbi:DUF502 domain-containing protein [Bacteroidota bacterium]